MKLLEVGDRDDDQQVQSSSDHRDGREQDVSQHDLKVRSEGFLAGGVEELREAELSPVHSLHS